MFIWLVLGISSHSFRPPPVLSISWLVSHPPVPTKGIYRLNHDASLCVAASFSLHSNLARRHGRVYPFQKMEKLSPKRLGPHGAKQQSWDWSTWFLWHQSIRYATSISASCWVVPFLIKLTDSFWCLPVSVLLVWMKMPSCSGSWLSRCFTTGLLPAAFAHVGSGSFWTSFLPRTLGKGVQQGKRTALWGCVPPICGMALGRQGDQPWS